METAICGSTLLAACRISSDGLTFTSKRPEVTHPGASTQLGVMVRTALSNMQTGRQTDRQTDRQ